MTDCETSMDYDRLLGDECDTETKARNLEQVGKPKRAKIAWFIVCFLALFLISLVGFCLLMVAFCNIAHPQHRLEAVSKELPSTQLRPEHFVDHGSKRVKIRYGPFAVPGSGENNGMKKFDLLNATPPCQGCLITRIQAGLEFADGSNANDATGMWLHHTVLINTLRPATKVWGPSPWQPSPERFFASGNERTPLDMTLNGTEKTGYWLGESDVLAMTSELMNMRKELREAFITITYEYIPYRPSDFSTITTIWFDVGDKTASEVAVPENKSSFDLYMDPWVATINARILQLGGHIHDGGTYLDILKNKKSVCRSAATYDHVTKRKRHMPGMDTKHIVGMSICYHTGRIQKGEVWVVKAHYDFDAQKPMLDQSGKPENVMGISIMYTIED